MAVRTPPHAPFEVCAALVGIEGDCDVVPSSERGALGWDVIVRLRQYKDYIAHYHTAGVPGRGDLDNAQEINYPAVMQAIVDTGYQGYVGQEFIPRESDKIASLRNAAKLCDV